MSAADRMVVRTLDGAYRSVPRRQALGMIAAGRAHHAPAEPVPTVEPVPGDAGVLAELLAAASTPAVAPGDLAEHLDAERRRLLPADKQDLYRHPLDGVDVADLLPDVSAERGAVVYPEHVGVDAEPLKTVDIEITTTPEMAELIGLTPSEPPAEPRGNAGRDEWAQYARDLGVEVTDGMGRNRIRDAAQDAAQSLARLPQPALTGGRLETPEDEPVTEESVTDDEDPGTR
jgi:hypothetical protein